ncbi:MAG: hypothetical protein HND27_02200 [Bacteroidetes bacterium]|nr:hypothetical protein [Flavobacteriales bacterium]NOG94570.1 hypothetical protein [Bacteroidota bacterium]WKZ75663.1 MAG: hypothetical protein QY303_01970 [Vicingaceae bacterium]GIK69135.1 MAG: hypothetical protein BroJett020_04300 [Bacteroidota bacterium]
MKWVGKEYKVPRLHGADSYYQNAKNEAEQHGRDLHGGVKTANICSVNK